MEKTLRTFSLSHFSRLALLLFSVMIMSVGVSWGQSTETATSTTMSANLSYQDLESGKPIQYKNSSSNSYSQPIRIYANNTFTINATEGAEQIIEISIVANNSSYATATGNATWTASGTGNCSASTSVDGQNITVTISGTAKTITCKPSAQIRWDQLSVTYITSGPTTYTIHYECDGASSCPSDVTGITAGTEVYLANAPTRSHYTFEGWKNGQITYNAGDPFSVNSNATFTAQWVSDGTGGDGSICFSNQTSCIAINNTSITGNDDLNNTWTITTSGTSSFTPNSSYYQVGSGNAPATNITFTTSFDEIVNITDFSAKFGGFNATAGTIILKVDNTNIGSGSFDAGNDVTITNTEAAEGTTLTVIVTPTSGGVKCYNISYSYETTAPNPAVTTIITIDATNLTNTDVYTSTTAGSLEPPSLGLQATLALPPLMLTEL